MPLEAVVLGMGEDQADDLLGQRLELKKDMKERKEKGLSPLEQAILLYQGKILDERHRYKAWDELGLEGDPPYEVFSPDKHGTLGAWMRAKSRNMVHRHIPADQKAAVFLKAVDAFPELKDALDGIEKANRKRKSEGKPLDASDQRGNTAKQVGELAGVGPTTMKGVTKLKKEAPDKFEEVAAGKKTVKKALKEVKKAKPKADKPVPKLKLAVPPFEAGEPHEPEPVKAAEGGEDKVEAWKRQIADNPTEFLRRTASMLQTFSAKKWFHNRQIRPPGSFFAGETVTPWRL